MSVSIEQLLNKLKFETYIEVSDLNIVEYLVNFHNVIVIEVSGYNHTICNRNIYDAVKKVAEQFKTMESHIGY